METATLIRMANQIAGYFKSYPEDEAVTEIAKHLRSFWDPRMRQHLLRAIEEPQIVARLEPTLVKSLRRQDSSWT